MEVIQKLKPKAVALGFTEEELKVVATQIKGTLPENATDEQIDAAIDAAIPFLKVSQTAVNRIVNAEKAKETNHQNPQGPKTEPKKEGSKNPEEVEAEPAWFKAFRETQEARIAKIEQAGISKSRRTVFEEKIKDLPDKYKASMLEDFDLLTFKDDAEFSGYLEKKAVRITEISQELADKGLAKNPKPGGDGKGKTEEDQFVQTMHDINKPEGEEKK